MQCFNGANTFQAFPAHLEQMKKKVAALSAQEMDKTDREAWIDYFYAEFQIEPIVMYLESKDIDIREQTVQAYNTWFRVGRMGPEYIDMPGYRVACKVPFSGDPELFELRPNPFTLDSFEVDGIEKPGKDGIGYLILGHDFVQRDASAEGIEAHFEQRISAIQSEAEKVNIEARRFNEGLRDAVENAVDERIRQIDKLADIKRSLNIPLNRVEGAPSAKPVRLKKRKLSFSRPTPNATHETAYCISDADYEAINTIIDDCGSLMEQAPESFSSLNEEQLRDYLRGMLGTHYDNVTGETFRNKGKTDIHIPFEGHVAYIAECKIWHGRKAFLAALEQLFSYTTWRDTKVSVIVFNKDNKSFDKVAEEIQGALDDRSAQVERKSHSLWSCKIQASDERVMYVVVHAFNLRP